ncbi:MAG TPA: hypothetical protein VIN10_01400 [Bacteroidales bacterium]
MKKVILQVVLFIAIVVLSYFVYESIMEPVRFEAEKTKRETVVVNKLKDIRSSQLIYRQMKGSFTGSFDTLKQFLEIAEIPVVKIVPDPTDTTFTKTINDTIGYIKVKDSLFSKKSYTIDQLAIVPFSNGALFEMDADTIERGGVNVNVFEVKTPFTTYLQGLDKQTVFNLTSKMEDIEKYPGLKVGSMLEPSTNGNWE